MAGSRQIEVQLEDRTPHKWIVPLAEDVFQSFQSKSNQMTRKVLGDGSLFSPMLFGKFFDPSDAFPLWEFEADVLLSNLRASGSNNNQVDWGFTDKEYVVKAELPGVGEEVVHICVEKGKILEVSGQLKQHQQQQADTKVRDWRSNHWWEHGFVRRIELPENADWKKTEATVKNDTILEIKIPVKASTSPIRQGDDSE